ncbi:protein S100-A1-like isoform X1 [Poecilia formosa]|uniref:protein S100-A1-like isoform X1 n=1 Tax=Poecilia formosa TaxID=48698 RepID=UPI000443FE3D|nr:PREDICTED: protein S100-A1-like isoform X1 [Poecilia formosa]
MRGKLSSRRLFGQELFAPLFKTAKMSSTLQGAMEDLIKVFYRYSGNEGDKYKLNKKELKKMFQEELSEFLNGSNDPGMVEKIMTGLDDNKDGEVDFQEFVVLVAALTVACNEFFVDCLKENKGSS